MRKSHLAILLVLTAFVLVAGIFLGFFSRLLLSAVQGPQFANTPTIVQQVRTLSELVTVQYVVEKVVILEDIKWIAVLGESRVLMVAHGKVNAGIDLSQIGPDDISISGKSITVKLPQSKIMDVFLDESQTRVIERTTGLLRTFDKDMEQTARQNAVDDIRRSARYGGITKEADKRARLQLENLFRQMGFHDVQFKSK
jgi:hypothetical protein